MANGITNISGGKALSGTAQPSDVRMGMTYADGKELREGTLDLTNLRAENVKKDVNIAGVVGQYVNAPNVTPFPAYSGSGAAVKSEQGFKMGFISTRNNQSRRFFKTNINGSFNIEIYFSNYPIHFQIYKNGALVLDKTVMARTEKLNLECVYGDVFEIRTLPNLNGHRLEHYAIAYETDRAPVETYETQPNRGGLYGSGFYKYSQPRGVKGLSALPSDVRMGQTFSTDGKTVQTGTMNLTNLNAYNIRENVNINGVVGKFTGLEGVFRSTRYTGAETVIEQSAQAHNVQTTKVFTSSPVKVSGHYYIHFTLTHGSKRGRPYIRIKRNGATLEHSENLEGAHIQIRKEVQLYSGDVIEFEAGNYQAAFVGSHVSAQIVGYIKPPTAEQIQSFCRFTIT